MRVLLTIMIKESAKDKYLIKKRKKIEHTLHKILIHTYEWSKKQEYLRKNETR